MKLFATQEIRRFFQGISAVWLAVLLLAEGIVWRQTGTISLGLLVLIGLGWGITGVIFLRYFRRQNALLEQAVSRINAYLAGDRTARIPCDEEGELYHLFHAVNSLAAVLNAHAENELREKAFLKNTISDISHQLKTPLAALNIYNGLLQEETTDQPDLKEFADRSEQELDRMETLVQNLLKITKLDAGAIVLAQQETAVAELMQASARRFAYRAQQEEKTLTLSGPEDVCLLCDQTWLGEAVDNLVKNALDHTKAGDEVRLTWQALPAAVQLTVADNGSGIHPEDLPHIFKRFYRSRFSQDTQGLGLGLPLAKAIVEAHGGTIGVDSARGRGTVFTLFFPFPTKS